MTTVLTTDLRDAWRSLRATPIVAAVALGSLALGIGANTALFSIRERLALKTRPVREPARLAIPGRGRLDQSDLGAGTGATARLGATAHRVGAQPASTWRIRGKPTWWMAPGSAAKSSTSSA